MRMIEQRVSKVSNDALPLLEEGGSATHPPSGNCHRPLTPVTENFRGLTTLGIKLVVRHSQLYRPGSRP